jgi:acetylornithine aminotransferase
MNPLIPLVESGNIVITRSEDCYLYDSDGERYIDMESGVWCVNLGHKHKRINRIISRQLDKSMHLGYQVKCDLPEQLSEKLLEKLRLYGGQSVFLNSGSEAVNLAITLAIHLTGREGICTIKGSYLSAYGYANQSVKNNTVTTIANNDYEKISACNFNDIAAFVFESGVSYGHVNVPSHEFVYTLVNKAKDAGCMILVDEVTTGIGRTGKWFGFEHFRLSPDIVACGKGLGNGYPVSSVSIRETIVSNLEKHSFRYAQSHMNDPMGCAIALGVLKEIERSNLIQQVEEKGILFKSLLKQLSVKYDIIKDVRGMGLMLAIEFSEERIAGHVHRFLLSRKIICGMKAAVIRFLPPLVIHHDIIHEVVDTIELSIKNL